MSQDPFGDIPLFREIQRLLAAGGGPVNLEIARQIALAAATQGSQDANISPEVVRSFVAAVHDAEALLSGYTRRSPDEPIRSRAVGRAWWVTETLKSWKWLLDHLGRRLTETLSAMGPERGGEEEGPMGVALGQVAPLMMGVQAGTLLGQLGSEALGRYDWPIPRDDDSQLFFVVPNVEQLGDDYGLEADGFRRWLAVRDTARHLLVSSVPWLSSYLRSLLVEVVDAMEVDTDAFEQRLLELQSKGPEALQEGLGLDTALPIAQTERHRKALERLQAFQGAFEGYAAHASAAVMKEMVEDHARIDEGMARHAQSPSPADNMISSILGISMDRASETSGATFCAAVVRLKGMAALNRVWDAPDNLPVAAEIKDPFAWMERVLTED
jgi:putative hydrolase